MCVLESQRNVQPSLGSFASFVLFLLCVRCVYSAPGRVARQRLRHRPRPRLPGKCCKSAKIPPNHVGQCSIAVSIARRTISVPRGRKQAMLAVSALGLLLLSWCMEGASLSPRTNDWAPPLTPVAGYTVTHGDCGYPVCGTLMSKGATPHKTMDDIAAVCNATAGCEGFNSNGWLKGCLPPRCPAGLKGLEPNAPSNLYTKVGPPKPLPPPAPPAPVPDIEDAFYPKEEEQQLLAADIPTVVSTDPEDRSCVLRLGDGTTVTVKEGGAVQGGDWTLLAVYAGVEVALERRWQRWSVLVLANTAGYSPIMVRKPLGHLTQINLTTYKPGFIDFKLAASDPKDYIGQRIINESEHGEASFLKAAKFLPPIADYVVTGDVNAPVKAVVTMDGTIKRSDGGDNEPIPPPGLLSLDPEPHHGNVKDALACSTSYDCRTPPRDRSYCFQGQCVGGGGPIFSAAAFLNQSTSDYDQLQTGVLGGHLRVASVGCYSSKDKEGFELMALGPLSPHESESLGFSKGNDTVLVALRPYMPPGREPTGQPYTFLSFSLDKAPCSGGTPVGGAPGSLTAACQISPGQFFGAVLAHASQWKSQFDAGMQLQIPYAERRQVDMAKGVIVSGSTVFIGDGPNYGTGGNYWMSSPPSRAMMDTEASKGIADSLPLTSLALDGALLRWGLFDSALAKVGFYFQHFIFSNGTIDMGHWKDRWASNSSFFLLLCAFWADLFFFHLIGGLTLAMGSTTVHIQMVSQTMGGCCSYLLTLYGTLGTRRGWRNISVPRRGLVNTCCGRGTSH
eukprot:COSAG02_NODE_1656_length_11472_cov_4.522729_4_plen_788_part_00